MKESDIRRTLKFLLSGKTGRDVTELTPLAQSGSNRRYYRLCDGSATYIGTFVPDAAEGECFVRLAHDFRSSGRSVPKVIAVSEDYRFYIQEDLGNVSLFSMLGVPEAKEYIKETFRRLVSLQKTPQAVWSRDCMSRPFSYRQAMWDLNYFKYEYLRPLEALYDEDRLEDDFERLADRLSSVAGEFEGFMMRDCQSRNVMLTADGPVFIDFQGGRKGPALYDAVSFLWQARAGFDEETRRELLDFYCGLYCEGDKDKVEEMLFDLDGFVLFRVLQVLGAYGFRGIVQKKTHFLMSIPAALANLRALMEKGVLEDYPELRKACFQIAYTDGLKLAAGGSGLTVEVFSFSYKKGYPDDFSGNGGGFMFDCRALHNPGRYAEYRLLTGRDEPVKVFLKVMGEAEPFLRGAWALTDQAIERYVSRGFTHLQIGFGCTGGQHRSVYCAEQTALHIGRVFPEVKVDLIHRELQSN